MAGKGREIADAYIDVHGDLSKFRRDLRRGSLAAAKEAGGEAGDKFGDEMKARLDRKTNGQMKEIFDAAFEGTDESWDKVFKGFDQNVDEAHKKASEFLKDMHKELVIVEKDYDELNTRMAEGRKLVDQANAVEDKHNDKIAEGIQLRRKQLRTQAEVGASLKRMYKDASVDAKRFEALVKRIGDHFANEDLAKHNALLKEGNRLRLDQAVTQDRVKSKLKGLYKDAAKELAEYNDFLKEEQRLIGQFQLGRHNALIEEGTRLRREQATTEARLGAERKRLIAEAREELAAFNRTFEGMTIESEKRVFEKNWRRLGDYMADADLGPNKKSVAAATEFANKMRETLKVARGQKLIDVGSVILVNSQLDKTIKLAQEYEDGIRESNGELRKGNLFTRLIGKATDRVRTSWLRMDSTVRTVIGLIAAGAGPIATLGSGLSASIVAVASSVGMAASSVVPLGAAVVALGVGAGLAVASFDTMKKDTPGLTKAIEAVGDAWQGQAKKFGQEWGGALKGLMTTLSTSLANSDIGAGLGQAFAGITTAFDDVLKGPGFQTFLKEMGPGGALADAVEGLGVGFAGMFEWMMNMFAAAAPVARELGELFGQWGQKLADGSSSLGAWDDMTATFERGKDSLLVILDLIGSVGSMFGTIFGLGADAGDRLLTSLTGVVDKFNAWMQTDAGREAMLEWFENGERIIRSLEPLLVGLGQAMGILVTPETIGQVENLMASLGGFLPILGEVLSVVSELQIFNAIALALEAFGAFLTPILPPLQELAQMLGATLVGAIGAVIPLFGAIGSALAPVIGHVAAFIGQVGPPFVGMLQELSVKLQPLIGFLGQVAEVIVGVLLPIIGGVLIGAFNAVIGLVDGVILAFQGIWNILTGLGDFIVAVFTGNWTGAWEAMGQIAEGFGQLISGVVMAIWNFVQLWFVGKLVGGLVGAVKAIGAMFKTGWNGFFTLIKDAVVKIQSKVKEIFEAIGNWLKEKVTNIGTNFTNGWSAIKTGVSTWFGKVKTAITDIFTAVVTWLKGIPGKIKSAIGNIGNLHTTVKGWVDRVKEGIKSKFEAAVSWLRGVPGKITGALGSLGSLLWNAGSSIIGGLLNGLKAKWGEVTGFVGGIADWIRNNKGPLPYDRRLLIPAGQAIMDGLMEGLTGRMLALGKKLALITDQLATGIKEAAILKESSKDLADVLVGDLDNYILAGQTAAEAFANAFNDSVSLRIGSIPLGVGTPFDSALATTPVNGLPSALRGHAPGGSNILTIESGAIQLVSQVRNPETAARIVLDELAAYAK